MVARAAAITRQFKEKRKAGGGGLDLPGPSSTRVHSTDF